MTTVFNAANEYAVGRFLKKEIGFLDITDSIEYAMNHHNIVENPTVEQILDTEQGVYALLEEAFRKHEIG